MSNTDGNGVQPQSSTSSSPLKRRRLSFGDDYCNTVESNGSNDDGKTSNASTSSANEHMMMAKEQDTDHYKCHASRKEEPGIEDEEQDVDPLPSSVKIFNDPVHGHIEIHEACIAIIDTPQFQRLRFIKQLGFCYFVYPGASHNRFEHSLGVCHLAGQLATSLHHRQPKLGITRKDILCVEIAGLCHDLGHGPHSHMFDGKFIPRVTGSIAWKHEQASLDMLDHLLEVNDLMAVGSVLRKHGIDDRDIEFIKELINGPRGDRDAKWQYRGRDEDKAFLYEIVSNKHTGIDVDKWDYFARDCLHMGQTNNFDHRRFIKYARVLEVNGRRRICGRDKEVSNLYQMFYTRYNLHRTAYQHKVSSACEIMAVEALVKANDILKLPGKNGRKCTLSECKDDMVAYTALTDNILWQIYTSDDPKLAEAKAIMHRLYTRDIYRCLDQRSVSEKLQKELSKSKMTFLDKLKDEMIQESTLSTLKKSDFRLQEVYMDFGMKDKNPLDEMWYYSKSDLNTPKKGSTAGLLTPPKFEDNLLRVYSINENKNLDSLIEESFRKLCHNWDMEHISAEQLPEQTLTPKGWRGDPCQTPDKKPPSPQSDISAGKGIAIMS